MAKKSEKSGEQISAESLTREPEVVNQEPPPSAAPKTAAEYPQFLEDAKALLKATANPTGDSTTVCLGGYNHAATLAGDTLEISAAGLPADFSLAESPEGYFPATKQRFTIVSHVRDEKTLSVTIAPPA